jgi:hypothetical protein
MIRATLEGKNGRTDNARSITERIDPNDNHMAENNSAEGVCFYPVDFG